MIEDGASALPGPFSSSAPGAVAPSHAAGLPPLAGVGLKPEHFSDILAQPPRVGFFEAHAENYFVAGGPLHRQLARIRERYPLSIHGVALSIGGEQALDRAHLQALKRLLDRYQPESFSEHLAWSSHGGTFFNDLLPVAYTARALARVCEHVEQTQEFLGRTMLLENPASYVAFAASTIDEADFLAAVVDRTGCGLLLDVNNIYVSCVNHGRDPDEYLRRLPLERTGEIHLAGFAEQQDAAGDRLLIDHHGSPVATAVWALYRDALRLAGPVATLIERDHELPPFAALVKEAARAQRLIDAVRRRASAASMPCWSRAKQLPHSGQDEHRGKLRT